MSSRTSQQIRPAAFAQLSRKDAAFLRRCVNPEFEPKNVAAREEFYQMMNRVLREQPTYFLDALETLFPLVKNANTKLDRRDRLEARHYRPRA